MNVNERSQRVNFDAPYKGAGCTRRCKFEFVLAALSTLIGANSFIHSCSFGLLARSGSTFASNADHERPRVTNNSKSKASLWTGYARPCLRWC